MRYFISDIHLNDLGTFNREHRPFKNCQTFQKFLIKTWNKQATKQDEIFIVGDLFDCDNQHSTGWKTSTDFIKKIKAKIVLIIGNNEERIIKYFFNNNFKQFAQWCKENGIKEVHKHLLIDFHNQKIFLTHRPENCKENMLNFFGHIHKAGGLYRPFGINLACDLNYFKLFSEEYLLFLLNEKQTFWNTDISLNFWK